MDNIAQKYNRFLITVIAVSPFAAYFAIAFLHMEFMVIMQLLSYLGVLLLLLFRTESQPIIFPRYLFFYFLFILYVFYSAFVILDRDFKIKYLFDNLLIGAFNTMFIVENLNITKKYFNFLLNISKKILVIAVLVIVYQQVVSPGFFIRMDNDEINEIIGWGETQNRLLSIYSWLGGYLPIGFGFVPVFILIVEDLYKKNKRVLIWILLGIILAFLSKARWIMLNTILVFLVFVINHENKQKQILKFIFLAPLFLVSSFTLLETAGVDANGILHERILEDNKKRGSDKTASTRILAFQATNKFFWDQPFLGKGDIKFGMGGTGQQDYQLKKFLARRSSQIHVGYLSLLYMYGLVGTFLFMCFLYLLLKKLYKNAKITNRWAPFLGILGFALANTTLVTFDIGQMGLILVLVANKYYIENRIVRIKLND